MKILCVLAMIAVAVWLPFAFLDAMALQASIDAMQAGMTKIAGAGR